MFVKDVECGDGGPFNLQLLYNTYRLVSRCDTPSKLGGAPFTYRPHSLGVAATGVMLSLLRCSARRLHSIRSLGCSSAPRQSRAYGTSDLGLYCSNELSPRQYPHLMEGGGRVDKGTAQHQQPSTAGAILRRVIQGGKWGEFSLPLKAAEVLEGLNRATADRLQQWSSPLALPGTSLLPLPGFWQPVPLPRCREHSSGCDDDAEELREDSAGGLSDGGLWATSVRRKRVTKMRKHKWRKRRKLQRQSASRRVNK